MINLENEWVVLASRYSNNSEEVHVCFKEIHDHYTAAGRYYHDLKHLEHLLHLSHTYREKIKDKDIIDFAIFYHDIIYSTVFKNNERKSAELAEKRLSTLKVPADIIAIVSQFIKATESHEVEMSAYADDLALFLDFDMSILGSKWEEYYAYTQNVRKEYSLYPNAMYKKGRKQFLEHTLLKPIIFHSPEFQLNFETTARQNMQKELSTL